MVPTKLLFISVVAFLVPISAFAQPALTDTLFVNVSTEKAIAVYNKSNKNYSHLYNGREFIPFKKNMPEVGTPYFYSEDWEEADVYYDGELYEHVNLRYDILREKVAVEHPGYSDIELINEKIKYFIMAGHTFVRLDSKLGNKPVISPGFYDELYNNTSKVYVKRLKVTEERIETQVSIILTYKEKNTYIVNKNGTYHIVGNKASVLKVFGDQKSALRKFISKNKIKYRNNREAALVKIVGYYDEISH